MLDDYMNWRSIAKERLGDAAAFFKNIAFSGLVRRFLDHPEDTEAREQLRAWLDKYTGPIISTTVWGLARVSVVRNAVTAGFAPACRRAGDKYPSDFSTLDIRRRGLK
jgi:hypothetical protein